jgi:AAA family ATP:ADP antiporter
MASSPLDEPTKTMIVPRPDDFKAALFLVTKREEKYKAKAAIDTFFVRGGDTLSALAVLAGTQLLGLPIERYALINVAVLVVLIGVCLKLIPAYRRRRAAADAAAAAAS